MAIWSSMLIFFFFIIPVITLIKRSIEKDSVELYCPLPFCNKGADTFDQSAASMADA